MKLKLAKGNRPIRALKIEDVQAYFNEHLRDKELSYRHRCRNSYLAVMNWAVEKKYCDAEYPKPDLPDHDPCEIQVNKNLPLPVIELFVEFAPEHAKLLFDTMFDTGLRGGELLIVNRTEPNKKQPRRSGLSLEEGNEHIRLGVTKDGKPITRSISERLAEEMRKELGKRQDTHDALS
jgi:hypothetical protein